MQLTLVTLGALQASATDAEGVTRTLGRGKPVAMLAYLGCIPGHRASREHLAALLWGDVDSEAARQNLRQTIWYLKKKLGDGVLDVTGEMVGLSAPCACDRDEFLHAAQRADFSVAVQRYAGPFIPDFAAPGASEFEQFCELERRRLTVTFRRCADALARQWLSEGKFRDAQELARRARDVDPMDQGTWRLLLEALLAGSDGLGALTEAEHFEAFFAREGHEPEAASLAALRNARRSPAIRTRGDVPPSNSIAAELVGRETEFSHLLAAWEQARGGGPRVVVISAAAGLGKSRLLRDVQARLRASRARALLIRANPGDRHLSGGFAAVVASELAELPGAAAVSTGSAGVLVSLAPALASVYASATADTSDGADAVRRRALALVDLLHAISDEHPLALLLDDLHWADDQSAQMIAAALSHLEHTRLLVVLTRRPVADPRAVFGAFEHLDLPPLDLSAVSALVAQVAELPATAWADVLPQQLLLATGGSPLLLVETLHDALEQGTLSVSERGVWECDEPARVTALLREGSALRQRILRLPPCAQRTLLVLSLVGRPLDLATATTIVGEDAPSLQEQVETLERGGFVTRRGSQLVVAHDEIASAITEATSEEHRRAVHAAIARALLAVADDDLTLRRVVEHAAAAHDDAMVLAAWSRFLASRRRQGDRRATRRVAADFLRSSSEQQSVIDLVAATPWSRRQRSRWLGAAGLIVATALGGALAWPRAPRELTADFAVWTVDSATGRGRLVGARISPNAPWEAGSPLQAVDLDSAAFPPMPRGTKQALLRSPNGKEWWTLVVDEALGDEAVFIDSLGVEHRPLSSPSDDAITTLSPDGRQFVGVTARYDTATDHLSIVTGDVRGSRLTRVTSTLEYDRAPAWRPDGTQIAFQRHYYTVRSPDRVCLVDVDGSNERCLSTALQENESLIGWLDERRVLLSIGAHELFTLDVESGERARMANLQGQISAFGGQLRLCDCSVADGVRSSFYLFPSENPAAARPIHYRGKPLRGNVRIVAPDVPRGQWLERVQLTVPEEGLALGSTHYLAVEGVRRNGATAWLHDLRWTSRDPAIAAVDSRGRLQPHRAGATWVIVSAGGWRTDSALVRVVPSTEHRVLTETWGDGWDRRWRPFGNPRAIVVQTDRGAALLPNGDGSYGSGAYSTTSMATEEGVGVEALVSLLVNGTQWQTLAIDFADASLLDMVRAWDHRTGDFAPHVRHTCAVSFPGTEGASFQDYFAFSAQGGSRVFRRPPGLFDGSWHRIRMQYRPDGRCALALDGQPLAVLPSSAPPSGRVVIVIAGHDRFGGRLIVGPLEVWTGVRRGVDWTKLDAEPAGTPPR